MAVADGSVREETVLAELAAEPAVEPPSRERIAEAAIEPSSDESARAAMVTAARSAPAAATLLAASTETMVSVERVE